MSQVLRSLENDLSQVVRSSLLIKPILELSARKNLLGDNDASKKIWQQIDEIWLSFAILDAIIQKMEMQRGASREEIEQIVLPKVKKQFSTLTEENELAERLSGIIQHTFSVLANKEERYKAFSYRYYDAEKCDFATYSFWLIKANYTSKDTDVLYAITEEGYRLYFGTYETGSLDRVAIGNLRLRLLLERGEIDNATKVAQSNTAACHYELLQVRSLSREIQRSIVAVDIEKVIGVKIQDCNLACKVGQETRQIRHMVDEIIDTSTDRIKLGKFHIIANELHKTENELLILISEITNLSEIFNQHKYKLFQRKNIKKSVPFSKILDACGALPEDVAETFGANFIASFSLPVRLQIFDLFNLFVSIDNYLEQNRESEASASLLNTESDEAPEWLGDIDSEIVAQAFSFLHEQAEKYPGIKLDTILKNSKKCEKPLFSRVLALNSFICYADEATSEKYKIGFKKIESASYIEEDLGDHYTYRGNQLEINTIS